MYHIKSESKCSGCKSESRKFAECTFIRCIKKKKGIEFCWDCEEMAFCEKWKKHREFSKHHDSFVCYQKLEENIHNIQENGIDEFEKQQKTREKILKKMLLEFNEGRSKTLYCISSTILEIHELENALDEAKKQSKNLEIKDKAKVLHLILTKIAKKKELLPEIKKIKQDKKLYVHFQ